MNFQMESDQVLRGPLHTKERGNMATTYEKQEFLDRFIKPVPLQEALEPLQKKTGVDFYGFYDKNYDVEPTRKGVEKENVRTTLSGSDEDYADIQPYLVSK